MFSRETQPSKISYSEFLTIVLEFNILPGLALESDAVAAAIKSRDRAELRRVLTEEF